MGLRNLDTSWHIEYLASGDGVKRHRGRCVFYDNENKHCRKYNSKCYGSAHCDYYDERIDDVVVESHQCVADTKEKNIISHDQGKQLYPLGTSVYHEKYGMGVAKDIRDGHINIDFRNFGEKCLSLQACVDNDYLI